MAGATPEVASRAGTVRAATATMGAFRNADRQTEAQDAGTTLWGVGPFLSGERGQRSLSWPFTGGLSFRRAGPVLFVGYQPVQQGFLLPCARKTARAWSVVTRAQRAEPASDKHAFARVIRAFGATKKVLWPITDSRGPPQCPPAKVGAIPPESGHYRTRRRRLAGESSPH